MNINGNNVEFTIREEEQKTGGHYQAKMESFIIPSGSGTVTHDFYYKHPVSMLSAQWINEGINAGDEIQFQVAPDTTIGVLSAHTPSGTTTLNVSSTVTQNIAVGYLAKAYSASGICDLGLVLDVNVPSGTITVDKATTQDFAAASTLIQQTINMVPYIKIPTQGRYNIGDSKIGGSYIPKNTILRIIYSNNDLQPKEFNVLLEYLY